MTPHSDPPDPEATDLSEASSGYAALLEAEVEDLELELSDKQRKTRRHFTWALLGISPAAMIPALGLLMEGSEGLLVLLVVLVTFSQLFLGLRASKEIRRLKKELKTLRRKIDPPGPNFTLISLD